MMRRSDPPPALQRYQRYLAALAALAAMPPVVSGATCVTLSRNATRTTGIWRALAQGHYRHNQPADSGGEAAPPSVVRPPWHRQDLHRPGRGVSIAPPRPTLCSGQANTRVVCKYKREHSFTLKVRHAGTSDLSSSGRVLNDPPARPSRGSCTEAHSRR
jgi:hypothetical protein